MHDCYNRDINYLRISITSRCNLSCQYCVPAGEHTSVTQGDELTFEQIEEVATIAAHECGFTKIRLTGGEPLLRKDVLYLISMLNNIKGIKDCSLTTNGVLLAPYANKLKLAGLERINISLDTVSEERYSEITGGAHIAPVLAGIKAARDAGFAPIKLNCVVENNADEPDAKAVAAFAYQYHLGVRYIKKMDMARGIFSVVDGGTGGDCPKCNRLRLSSDGRIYPCLFNSISFSIHELGAREALRQAIKHKPIKGEKSEHNCFYRIGG
jgi:cyclic pyranopterin phosphate synthase